MANVNKTPGKARRAEVAGGGFAGLTAAIALKQSGWDVRLHEKSSELRAFGAGSISGTTASASSRGWGRWTMSSRVRTRHRPTKPGCTTNPSRRRRSTACPGAS
ncbi:FAD-binding protein [Mesorhizobium amorphae]|uniref:FAD-binding protein n=1 Tax=Mesorhizobium amorphae TaxID=71433 RepID=UPI0021B1D170|nr:FAD-binding protein [Mesorhizobium amorphae]